MLRIKNNLPKFRSPFINQPHIRLPYRHLQTKKQLISLSTTTRAFDLHFATSNLRSSSLASSPLKFTYNKSYSSFSNSSSQPVFISNRKLILASISVLLSGVLYNTNEWRFYLGALARGIVAGLTGFTCIMDYKLFWPGEKEIEKYDKDTLKSIKSEINLRNAVRILEAMKFNGGVYIKLGQHLSALGYILPAEWTETFRPLHDRCPRTSKEELDEMLLKDFGESLEDLFVEFDETPIGVASIAQVHRARLRSNNQEVAVKLQHSKVSRYSLLDLKTTTLIVKLAKWALPDFEFDWLAEEMNRNMPLEMDFICEGENASRAKENFSASPQYALKIPDVYWATKRVICMEFVEGAKLNDHEYMRKHNIDPNQVSREVTRIFSEMIYRHGWVHCDAHPGNLMLRASDNKKGFEVVLLDHGLYRHLSDKFRILYAKLWKSIIDRDPIKTKEYSLALGGTDATYKLITGILTGRSWSSVHQTSKSTNVFAPDSDTSVAFISILPDIANLLSQVPRELIFLFKTQDLLKLVHHDLGATQDQKIQYLIMARYCSEAIYQDQLQNVFQPPVHSVVRLPVSNMTSLVWSWWTYWTFRAQLKVYLFVLTVRDLLVTDHTPSSSSPAPPSLIL